MRGANDGEKAKAEGGQGESTPQAPIQLEEAPGRRGDRRVPMDPRNPAQKRERESDSPKASNKFQAIEEESRTRDR